MTKEIGTTAPAHTYISTCSIKEIGEPQVREKSTFIRYTLIETQTNTRLYCNHFKRDEDTDFAIVSVGETWDVAITYSPRDKAQRQQPELWLNDDAKRWNNIHSFVERLSDATPQSVAAVKAIPAPSDSRELSIQRQVALKAAVEWAIACLPQGDAWTYSNILEIADGFNNWLMNKEGANGNNHEGN
jgi:hypothetical protein